MEFLERTPQLGELNAGLQDAVRGRGSLALVSGEAGIGKSTLVERFTQRQDRATRVFWGVCDALFSPRPLGPLHDMAPQFGGEVETLLASDASPAEIYPAVLKGLSARPAVMVFEDIHWADERTLDLLHYLSRRITRTSALVVMTYRDDGLGSRHPLQLLLGNLAGSPVVRRLPLAPLSENAVRELTGDQVLDAAALYRQTGGNPFYVTEVLANPESGIPPTVRDAVLARVARLSRSGHAVLEAASVIGMRVTPWLLNEVTGAEAQAVDESMAAGMLLAQDDRLVFRHELARQTILESISLPRRQVLHRLVLDSLKASPETRDDLARLAHHAEAAGDRAAILAYAPKAAEQASAAGAHRGAVALYALALRFADDLPLAEQAAMWAQYARECGFTAQRGEQVAAMRTAVDRWRQAEDPLKYGESLGRLAFDLHLVGERDEAAEVNNTAIQVLESLPSGPELEIVYNTGARLYLANMENRAALELAEKALALAERRGDEERRVWFTETLGLCLFFLDYPRGIETLEEALRAAQDLNLAARIANIYSNLSSLLVEYHEFDRADAHFTAGLALATEWEFEFSRMFLLSWRAYLHLLRGRWDAAEADIAEVLERPATFIVSRGPALMALGRLRARRGDPEPMVALDESLGVMEKLGYQQREGVLRGARAEAAWLAGEPERTLAEAQAVYERAVVQQQPWMTGELAFWRRRAGEDLEVPDWIATPYALHIAGDWYGAAAAWEAMGCPYEQARALADGDLEARRQALAIFEHLGARPAAQALRAQLQAAGVVDLPRKPRQATRANPFGLTRRQGEILDLLTENLTNAEIADRLHISPKTVDHHVSAVLAKLNVATRREAAELARQFPTDSP
jgi:DNA-binding CsgD family transcriptional regulator